MILWWLGHNFCILGNGNISVKVYLQLTQDSFWFLHAINKTGARFILWFPLRSALIQLLISARSGKIFSACILDHLVPWTWSPCGHFHFNTLSDILPTLEWNMTFPVVQIGPIAKLETLSLRHMVYYTWETTGLWRNWVFEIHTTSCQSSVTLLCSIYITGSISGKCYIHFGERFTLPNGGT